MKIRVIIGHNALESEMLEYVNDIVRDAEELRSKMAEIDVEIDRLQYFKKMGHNEVYRAEDCYSRGVYDDATPVSIDDEIEEFKEYKKEIVSRINELIELLPQF